MGSWSAIINLRTPSWINYLTAKRNSFCFFLFFFVFSDFQFSNLAPYQVKAVRQTKLCDSWTKSAFLWDDPDQDQLSNITQIMAHQRKREILAQSGFLGFSDVPWSGSLILIWIIPKERTPSWKTRLRDVSVLRDYLKGKTSLDKNEENLDIHICHQTASLILHSFHFIPF